MDELSPKEEAPARLPPMLRFLQALIIVLTLSLIGGVITVVAVIVTRFPRPVSLTPPMPEVLVLPAGLQAQAVTQGRDWVAVVTEDDQILIFDRQGGGLRQTVRIETAD